MCLNIVCDWTRGPDHSGSKILSDSKEKAVEPFSEARITEALPSRSKAPWRPWPSTQGIDGGTGIQRLSAPFRPLTNAWHEDPMPHSERLLDGRQFGRLNVSNGSLLPVRPTAKRSSLLPAPEVGQVSALGGTADLRRSARRVTAVGWRRHSKRQTRTSESSLFQSVGQPVPRWPADRRPQLGLGLPCRVPEPPFERSAVRSISVVRISR